MPREVTADDLTDEMIHELRRSIAGRVFPAAGMAHTGLSDLWNDTEDALAGRAYRSARARVAAEINARSKEAGRG